MSQFKKKITKELPIEEIKSIIEEATSELLNSPESRDTEDIKDLITNLVFERIQNLLSENLLTDISVKKTINKLINEAWLKTRDNLRKELENNVAQEEVKIEESNIQYIDLSNLPDISENPFLYLEYMKSREFEEDHEIRKYVDIQLTDLKEAETMEKRQEIAKKFKRSVNVLMH